MDIFSTTNYSVYAGEDPRSYTMTNTIRCRCGILASLTVTALWFTYLNVAILSDFCRAVIRATTCCLTVYIVYFCIYMFTIKAWLLQGRHWYGLSTLWRATLSNLLAYCRLRPTQPLTLSGTGNEYSSWATWWTEGLVRWLGRWYVCLYAALRV